MSTSIESIEEVHESIVQETPLSVLEGHNDRISDLLKRKERLQSDHGLEQFIAAYVTEALEERKRGERDAICDCRLPTCPLKRGKVPAPLRIRGTGMLRPINTRRRAAEWVLDHPGNAAALQEALDARDEEIGELHAEWMALYQQLQDGEWKDRFGVEGAEEEIES